MRSTLPAPRATVGGGVALLQRDMRASDRDREQAVAFLRVHYADGRLGEAELDWRCDAAYRAVGLRELDHLCADLPALAQPPRRRRRRSRALPVALLVLSLVALIVLVPPEVSIALVALMLVGMLVLATLLAPLWIPVLLGVIVYRLVCAARRPAAPPRVGWR
jgi:hypothetical protein